MRQCLSTPRRVPIFFNKSNKIFAAFQYSTVAPGHQGFLNHRTHPHLIGKGQLTAGIEKEEYRQRVKKLLFGKGPLSDEPLIREDFALVIQPAHKNRYLSGKIFYPFHQCSNLKYLTGIDDPDTIAVFLKQGRQDQMKYFLFYKEITREELIFDGERLGAKGAIEHYGADEAYPLDQFSEIMRKVLGNTSGSLSFSSPKYTAYVDLPGETEKEWLEDSRQHLAWPLDTVLSNSTIATHEYLHNILKSCSIKPLSPVLDQLRLVKSDAEIQLMKRSAQTAALSFNKTIASTQHLNLEAQVSATFEYHCRLNGASKLAFVPVVAGRGANSYILHYTRNDMELINGDLLLMDAGCIQSDYCSDISRTFPISGRFSDPQREIYEALLQIQMNLIDMAEEGQSLYQLLRLSQDMIRARILKKIMKIDGFKAKSLVRHLYPHHVGHYLGADLHDCRSISTDVPLKRGMCVTIEPGIYIPPLSIRDETFDIVPKHYRGISIRIEDDICISERGQKPIVMSKEAVKSVEEIEKLMNHL